MYYTSFLLLLVCFVFIHPITHTHLHWFKGDDIYQDSNVSIDCSQGNGNDFCDASGSSTDILTNWPTSMLERRCQSLG
jgi:hypothetical protein